MKEYMKNIIVKNQQEYFDYLLYFIYKNTSFSIMSSSTDFSNFKGFCNDHISNIINLLDENRRFCIQFKESLNSFDNADSILCEMDVIQKSSRNVSNEFSRRSNEFRYLLNKACCHIKMEEREKNFTTFQYCPTCHKSFNL